MIRWSSNALELINLGFSEFEQLTESELKLLCAVTAGIMAHCGVSPDEHFHNDPHFSGLWGTERTIRAKVIRWLCADSKASSYVDPAGIIIQGARIAGGLDLSFVRVTFPLTFIRCCLAAPAHLLFSRLDGLLLRGTVALAIQADGMEVQGDLRMFDGFCLRGELGLRGALIGGSVFLLDGALLGQNGVAIRADRIKVGGSIALRQGLNVEGAVHLNGAQIPGDLDFTTAVFCNFGENAVVVDGATIGGCLFLRSTTAIGTVRLVRASIAANLECDGVRLLAPAKEKLGVALGADGVSIRGDLFLRDQFRVEGQMRLLGANIDGDLQVTNGHFADGAELHAQKVRVGGRLFWRSVNLGNQTKVNLNHALVSIMADEEASWPQAGNLGVDGLVYSRFAEDRADTKMRLRWLHLQNGLEPHWFKRLLRAAVYGGGKGGTRGWQQKDWPVFRPQPYQQLAKGLREGGDSVAAKRVLVDMENQRRMYGNLTFLAWLWRWILRLFIGYGYRPWYAVLWGLGVVTIGSFLFRYGYDLGVMTPTKAQAYVTFEKSAVNERHGEPPPYYPRFVAPVYSLDTFLPILNLGEKSYWEPNPKEGAWGTRLRIWLWIQIVLGWLLTTLFVAGLTPIIRSG